MENPIGQLNKVFDSRIRIGIMSALMVNEELNFNDLKTLIDVTDGNLATHLKTLEENKFIKVEKGFIGRKTNTTYSNKLLLFRGNLIFTRIPHQTSKIKHSTSF